MVTDRPFAEVNLWQRIFAEPWANFIGAYEAEHRRVIPEHRETNVRKMLAYGDLRRGYYEYACPPRGQTRKIGFTCKSRLCLRCFKGAVDGWLETAQKVLFEGVGQRQVVLTVPPPIRTLILAEPKFRKVFVDAGAKAVQQLVAQWRPKKKIKVGIWRCCKGMGGRAIPLRICIWWSAKGEWIGRKNGGRSRISTPGSCASSGSIKS